MAIHRAKQPVFESLAGQHSFQIVASITIGLYRYHRRECENLVKKLTHFVSITSFAALSLAAFAQAPAAAPKGDPVAGKVKAVAVCSGCHGVPGTKTAYPEVYNVPKLGGQNAGYLLSALKSYKSGDRFNQTMKAQASALSEKEMADIAAYYGNDSAQMAAK